MAKKKIEAEVTDTVVEPKRIEAVKSNRVGVSTQNQMNKVTDQLIALVYSLEARITTLEQPSEQD